MGTTPTSGDFQAVNMTSESISGSPQTTASAQLRADRMSSGQIVTGLEVGGDINFEFAKTKFMDDFLEGAMFGTWQSSNIVTVDLEIDATAKTITRASGDFDTELDVGDVIVLSGFTNPANNTIAQVIQIVSATVIKCSFKGTVVNETATVTSAFQRGDRLTIGTTRNFYSIEKKFTDLTTKGINYRGSMISGFNIEAAYGAIITGAFNVMSTGYETADSAGELMTNSRTVKSPEAKNPFNGSIDMPFLTSSATGTLADVDFCIQSLNLSLNNNLQAQNCIGRIAPKDLTEGEATIEVGLNAYLSNDTWPILEKKLSQDPFAMGFLLSNVDGWYGFYLPAIQVSFDDPSSGGANQIISLDMSGTAKVGANNEKSLYIYRLPS